MVVLSDREEASAVSWEDHIHKPSTHVLTPPKLGALREMACYNSVYRKLLNDNGLFPKHVGGFSRIVGGPHR